MAGVAVPGRKVWITFTDINQSSDYSTSLQRNSEVKDLKVVIEQCCYIPMDKQQLLFKGQFMEDNKLLSDYGVEDEATIFVLTESVTHIASSNSDMAFRMSHFPELRPRSNESSVIFWILKATMNGQLFAEKKKKFHLVLNAFRQYEAGLIGRARGPLPFGASGGPLGNLEVREYESRLFNLQRALYSTVAVEYNQTVLESPGATSLMFNMMSIPQHLTEVLAFNQQLQDVLNSKPEMREMMQSPQFIGCVAKPEAVKELYGICQSLQSTVTDSTRGLERLVEVFYRFFEHKIKGIPPPLVELYLFELIQLEEMHLCEVTDSEKVTDSIQRCVMALSRSNGNLALAVKSLVNV